MIGLINWSKSGKSNVGYPSIFWIAISICFLINPVFAQNLMLDNSSIEENSAIGSRVGNVSTDDDSQTYTFILPSGQNDNDFFAINDNELNTAVIFDYETQSAYQVTIQAIDTLNQITSQDFTVNIVNLGPTDFAISKSSVDENLPPLATVGSFTSTGGIDPVTFSLINGSGDTNNDLFSVDENQLKTNISFDYESQSTYNIRVEARDADDEFFSKSLSITVNNLSEGPTDITLTNNSIPENEPENTTIGNLSAEGAAGNVTFSLPAGVKDNNFFSINGDELVSAIVFNYEDKTSYDITVEAVDETNTPFSKDFTIDITDLPGPTNILLSDTDVDENLPEGSFVATISAEGGNPPYTYNLATFNGGVDSDLFAIDGDQLLTNAVFDYETKDTYTIRLQVIVENEERTTKLFTINVNDLDEGPTGLLLSSDDIDENQAAGTSIGSFSTQGGTAPYTYALVSGNGDTDNALFSINGNELLSGVAFDFEAKNSFSIRVRSADDNGETFDKAFAITINDLVEAPTDLSLSASIIDENLPAGTSIGSFSTQGGTTPFIYQLVSGSGDNDNGQFVINGDELLSNAVFDFEAKSSFFIRAQTTDDNGENFAKAFTITVNDLDEGPTDITLSNNSIPENEPENTTIGNLSAEGAAGNVTFSLPAGVKDNDFFSINGDELISAIVFNYEDKNSFDVTIEAMDETNTPFSKDFTIDITDLPEGPTNLTLSSTEIDENQGVGTAIGSFSTEGGTSPYTYALVSGSGDTDNDQFSINNDELQSNIAFDFETKSSYSIRIQTTDDNGGNFAKTFTITVNDLDEGPTDILLSNNSIDENASVNTTVGMLSASGANGTVSYSLPSGQNDNSQFNISGDQLRSNAVFDYETTNSFTVTVQAVDDGNEPFSKSFTITVNDLDEGPTDLLLSSDDIDENQAAGTSIGSFSTQGGTAPYTYTLVSGNGDTDNALFSINGNELLSGVAFDFEAKNSFSIRVQSADDNGATFDKAFAITINDLVEAPTDLSLSASIIDENLPAGTSIGSFSTQGGTTPFIYQLVSGAGDNDNGQFVINGDELLSNAVFDFEAKSSFFIRAQTTDDNGENFAKAFTITVNDLDEGPTDITLSNNSIPENEPENTSIGNLSAEGAAGNVTFSLPAGVKDNDFFSINGDELISAIVFNYEDKNSFDITIEAVDETNTPFSKDFTIDITDLPGPTNILLSDNDVDENLPEGSFVATISAEGGPPPYTYNLATFNGGVDSDLFAIDGDQLLTNAVFDYETKDTYTIRLQVIVENEERTTKLFTINVNDLDESITDLTLDNNTVSENQPENTQIGTLSASGGTPPYTYAFVDGIGSENNDLFSITNNQLFTKQTFDYEIKDTYAVRVMVTDDQGSSLDKAFTIIVEDLQGPTAITLSPDDIEENQPGNTLVGTISATGGTPPYSFSFVSGDGDDDNGSFTIENGNELTSAQGFDFESTPSLSVRIIATDDNSEPFDQALSITILDRGPTDIILSDNQIAENQPADSEVGSFSTEGGTSPYSYTFIQSTPYEYNLFNLPGSDLTTTQPLDFENKTSHLIKVNSTDAEGEEFAKEFTIEVTDLAEAPTVSNPISDFSVDEDAENSTFDLNTVFSHTSALTYSVQNDNQDLVNASVSASTLTLAFQPNQFGQATITVTASDGSESTDDEFVVTVNPVNDNPTTSGIADVNVQENSSPIDINIYNAFADLEDTDENLTYSVVGNTVNTLVSTSINAENLTLTFAANQNGSSNITVRATDSGSKFVETSFTVNVADVMNTPVVDNPISDLSVDEDAGNSPIDLSGVFSDPDGDALTYSVQNNNETLVAASINATTLTLDFLPHQFGQATINVTASDGNESTQDEFVVTVNSVNDTPTTTGISDVNVNEDAPPFKINLSDAFEDIEDADEALSYQVSGNSAPSLLSTSVNQQELTLTFLADQNGTSTLIVEASDTEGASIQTSFKVTVNAVNDVPVATTVENKSVAENSEDMSINIFNVFEDIEDADAALTYTATSSNESLVTTQIVNPNLVLSFVPNATGSASITLTATDTQGGSIQSSFMVSVAEVNNAPSFVILGNPPASKEDAGKQTIAGFASDIQDGDDGSQQLSFNLTQTAFTGLIAFASGPSIDAITGDLTYTAQPNTFGTADYAVTLSDDGATGGNNNNISTEQSFTIVVQPVGDAPAVPGEVTINENEVASLAINRNSVDGSEVTHFKISNVIGGTLYQNDGVTAISDGSFITVAQGNAGVKFAPGTPFKENGSFKVNASTSNDDTGLGAESNAKINVVAFADKPVVSHAKTLEDEQTTSGLILERNPNDGGEVKYFKISNISGGQLFRNNGTTQISNNEVLPYEAGNAGLKFTPIPNSSANGSFTVQASLDVFGIFLSDTAVAVINVISVNDAPTLTVPADVAVDEETPVNIPGISMTDLDAGESSVSASLSVGNGILTLGDITGITFDEGSSNESASITISGTLTNVNNALASLSYQGNTGFAGSETLAITVSDNGNTGEEGGEQTAEGSVTINVNPVNDPPILGNIEGSTLSYSEDDPATAITSSITINDNDSEEMLSGSVKITGNYQSNQDVLTFPENHPHILGNFDVNTGTLLLTRKNSGSDFSVSVFQNALREVKYQNTNTATPETVVRTVTFIITDAGNLSSTVVTRNIAINTVNDPPELSNIESEALAFEPNTEPIITQTITISDIDGGNIASASVKIDQNYKQGEEVLEYTQIANITGKFFLNRGELVLEGENTPENYTDALQNINYKNFAAFPSSGNRLVTFSIRDTENNRSNEQSRFIAIGGNNLPPSIFDFSKEGTEDENIVFEIKDFRDAYLDDEGPGATPEEIRIKSVPKGGKLIYEETVITEAAATGDGFKVAKNKVDELVYQPNPDFSGSDNFTWNASDGNSFAANDAFVDLNVSPVNDDPVISAPDEFELNEDVPTVIPEISVADPDVGNGDLLVVISATTGFLTLKVKTGLTFITGTGELDKTMRFVGTLPVVNNALNTLTYTSKEHFIGADEVEITVRDNGNTGAGGNKADIELVSIEVMPVNDPAILSDKVEPDISYTENTPSIKILNGVNIGDFDDPPELISQAKVTIEEGYASGEDIITFVASEKISGELDNNILTLSGTATIGEYQQVIQNIRYENSSDRPDTTKRVISLQLTDEEDVKSNVLIKNINIIPVNDQPVIANLENNTLAYYDGQLSEGVTATAEVNDPDNENLSGATVQVIDNFQQGIDSLSVSGLINITPDWDAENGTLTLMGTDSKGMYQEALRKVQFHHTAGVTNESSKLLLLQINDGVEKSDSVFRSITIFPNNAPVVTSFSATTDEDTELSFTLNDFMGNYQDDDVPDDTLAGIQILTLPPNGSIVYNDEEITKAKLDTSTVIIPANEIGTLAYLPNSDYNGADSIGWSASDGIKTAAQQAFIQLTVNAVNDPPVAGNFSKTGKEDSTIVFAASDFNDVYSDVDNDGLQKVIIRKLPNHGTLKLGSFDVSQNSEISTGNLAELRYEPDLNYNGADSIFWSAVDPFSASENTGKISISLAPVNDAPMINSFTKTSNDIAAISFTTEDFSNHFLDIENDALQKIVITRLPGNGKLSVGEAEVSVNDTIINENINNLIYSPDPDIANSKDNFGWIASDATLFAAAPASVNIIIGTGVTDFSFNIQEDTPYNFSVTPFTDNFNSTSGELSFIRIDSLPTNGVLKLNESDVAEGQSIAIDDIPSLVYAPDADFFGEDSIYWNARNGGDFAPENAKIMASVSPVNDAPVISNIENQLVLVNQVAGPLSFSVDDIDSDPEEMSVTIASNNQKLIPDSEDNITLEMDESLQYRLNITPLPDSTGTATITVTASDGKAEASNSFTVDVVIDILEVDAGNDLEIVESESVQITATTTGGDEPFTFDWTCDQPECAIDDNTQPVINVSPTQTTTYFVEVTESKGLIAYDTITVNVTPRPTALNIPTGFTPDGREPNNLWIIDDIEFFESAVVEVYNRYGTRVFRSEGYNEPWDGTYKGDALPVGTYYYIVNIDNGGQVYKGSVVILR